MQFLMRELKFSLRTLFKRRAFSLITILVLALGIGANTAIFSVVNAVLLRPLPFEDSDRLVQIWHTPPAKSFPGMTKFSVSPANYLDWQAQNDTLEMAIYHGGTFTLTGSGEPVPVTGSQVSPEFFSVLRAKPLAGRAFIHDDGETSSAKDRRRPCNAGRYGLSSCMATLGGSSRHRPRTILGATTTSRWIRSACSSPGG